MVTVNFRLSGAGSVTLNIEAPKRLDEVIRQCAVQAGIRLGGYIAVRKGKVLTEAAEVGGEDEIDIFPAISGG